MTEKQVQALVVRALKTFIQGFLGVILAGVVGVNGITALKALIVGAFAAGISAVVNAYLKPEEAK